MISGVTVDLEAIWGSDLQNVIAVGATGTILRLK